MAKLNRGENSLTPPRLAGIDAGRKRAARAQRRKRAKGNVTTFVAAVVAIGVVAGAAWIGYTIYTEQQVRDTAETERRFAEVEAENEDKSATDNLVDFNEQPRWNGNPPPGYEAESEIEITPPAQP